MITINILNYFENLQVERISSQAVNSFINNSAVPVNNNYQEQFIMAIEIPKISLKKGLYNISSQHNNVDQNIEIIKESEFNENSIRNLILAGHSGNSKTSFFNNLYKLKLKDYIYIYYNKYKYIYEVIDIYEIPKTGYFYPQNYSENIITLITCKNNSKDLQIVYIGKLINKTLY